MGSAGAAQASGRAAPRVPEPPTRQATRRVSRTPRSWGPATPSNQDEPSAKPARSGARAGGSGCVPRRRGSGRRGLGPSKARSLCRRLQGPLRRRLRAVADPFPLFRNRGKHPVTATLNHATRARLRRSPPLAETKLRPKWCAPRPRSPASLAFPLPRPASPGDCERTQVLCFFSRWSAKRIKQCGLLPPTGRPQAFQIFAGPRAQGLPPGKGQPPPRRGGTISGEARGVRKS